MPYIDTINVGGTNYDIGGGGHAIEDASGTVLTQRDTLKIAGTLKATDDSTNEKTVISDAAEEVEWSVWNEMTEEERDEYSAGKKLDIVNVPGADGTIDADLIDLLWQNPDPSATFTPQDIILSSADYDELIVYFNYATGADEYFCSRAEKGTNFYLQYSLPTSQGVSVRNRPITYVTDGTQKKYHIGDCNFAVGTSAASVVNAYCVPIKIYGIKKTINLKINAIASDVSTSASKCMLSDGETSVGDVIDRGYVEVTADGSKSYATLLGELHSLLDYSKLTMNSKYYQINSSNDVIYVMNVAMINISSGFVTFSLASVGDSVTVQSIRVKSSSGKYCQGQFLTTSQVTFTDMSANTPGNGTKFRIYY